MDNTLEHELAQQRQRSGGITRSDEIQFELASLEVQRARIPEVGEKAVPFALPNENGSEVLLTDILKNGPVILNFFRGNWCDFCKIQLKALERSLDQFQKYHATLVGISPSVISIQTITKMENELSYAILSDVGCKVAKAYGLSYEMSDEMVSIFEGFGMEFDNLLGSEKEENHNFPIPATFVIDQNMNVVYKYANSDHTRRAEPSEIVASLMSIT